MTQLKALALKYFPYAKRPVTSDKWLTPFSARARAMRLAEEVANQRLRAAAQLLDGRSAEIVGSYITNLPSRERELERALRCVAKMSESAGAAKVAQDALDWQD